MSAPISKASRPRKANSIHIVEDSEQEIVLTNPLTRKRMSLQGSGLVIWRLCDGARSIEQITELLQQAYPDADGLGEDVQQSIAQLVEDKYLLFDGGESALEYQGDVVRTIEPNIELLWQLEQIRNFLFGVMRLDRVSSLETDLEELLGEQALINAKEHDADSARSLDDSSVISYRGALSSPSFATCVDTIVDELGKAFPEIDSPITLSGNAVYLRGSHMGWHSNHSRADGRIYCSWAEEEESNFFRYEHPLTGEVVTEWEKPGWNIKSFTIPEKPSRFWHAIGAKSLRLSIGFRYDLPTG